MHPVSRETLITHLAYSIWANNALLDACSRLSDEEVLRDLGGSHRSIGETLAHIYYADRIWLSRCEGVTLPSFMDPVTPTVAELKERWPALLQRFQAWVAAQPEERLLERLTAKRLNGTSFSLAYWKVLLHVVNHATMHRGQVMGMLRQLGHQPPSTDIFFYYLSQEVK